MEKNTRNTKTSIKAMTIKFLSVLLLLSLDIAADERRRAFHLHKTDIHSAAAWHTIHYSI